MPGRTGDAVPPSLYLGGNMTRLLNGKVLLPGKTFKHVIKLFLG
jgi:hypothetical protein